MKFYLLGVLFCFLLACSESETNAASPPYSIDLSSSSGQAEPSSSSGQAEPSSSSGQAVLSSSGNIWSNRYDCNEFDCVTTVALNPSIEYGEFLDTRDNQVYRTVQIGSQIWMAQNLNYASDGSRCYSDSISRCLIVGRLYTWEEAKKVCPEGWHLPDSAEFQVLNDYALDNKPADVTTIRASLTSQYNKRGSRGSDDFGFSVILGAGYWFTSWKCYDDGSLREGETFYWSATERSVEKGHVRYLMVTAVDYYSKMLAGGRLKTDAYSVRCIKD